MKGTTEINLAKIQGDFKNLLFASCLQEFSWGYCCIYNNNQLDCRCFTLALSSPALCPPLLCDSLLWMIQQATTCSSQKFVNIHSDIIVYVFDAMLLHTTYSQNTLSGYAVARDGICFFVFYYPITLFALFPFLLDTALHSQVSSPRNSSTAGAGRVVTVMHGYTEWIEEEEEEEGLRDDRRSRKQGMKRQSDRW